MSGPSELRATSLINLSPLSFLYFIHTFSPFELIQPRARFLAWSACAVPHLCALIIRFTPSGTPPTVGLERCCSFLQHWFNLSIRSENTL